VVVIFIAISPVSFFTTNENCLTVYYFTSFAIVTPVSNDTSASGTQLFFFMSTTLCNPMYSFVRCQCHSQQQNNNNAVFIFISLGLKTSTHKQQQQLHHYYSTIIITELLTTTNSITKGYKIQNVSSIFTVTSLKPY
jgi:hypothetical protein